MSILSQTSLLFSYCMFNKLMISTVLSTKGPVSKPQLPPGCPAWRQTRALLPSPRKPCQQDGRVCSVPVASAGSSPTVACAQTGQPMATQERFLSLSSFHRSRAGHQEGEEHSQATNHSATELELHHKTSLNRHATLHRGGLSVSA